MGKLTAKARWLFGNTFILFTTCYDSSESTNHILAAGRWGEKDVRLHYWALRVTTLTWLKWTLRFACVGQLRWFLALPATAHQVQSVGFAFGGVLFLGRPVQKVKDLSGAKTSCASFWEAVRYLSNWEGTPLSSFGVHMFCSFAKYNFFNPLRVRLLLLYMSCISRERLFWNSLISKLTWFN